MTTITALPTPPSRDDPANFATRADAFLGALPDFVTETNTVAGEVNTNASNAATSASNASTSASNASTSASNAATSENNAATSEANAATSEANAANYAAALKGTSTTSLTIGTGSKTFTTQSGKQWAAGQFVVAVDSANSANYMHGQVTSYATTSLVLDVQSTGGSGTIASWNIYVAGNRGAQGAAGTGDFMADGTVPMTGNLVLNATYGVVFEGTTADAYETTLVAGEPTADRTITLPDATCTLGYKNIPAVGTKTGSYTLAVGDVGKYVQCGSGAAITIPDATFAEGDVISLFNNTTGTITITCTITTAYIAGTDSDKATMTLAARGLATILFLSGTVCVVNGSVT